MNLQASLAIFSLTVPLVECGSQSGAQEIIRTWPICCRHSTLYRKGDFEGMSE